MFIKARNLHAIFTFQNPANFYQGGSESFNSRLAVDSSKGKSFKPSIGALIVGH